MDESYTAVGDIVVLSYHEPAGPLGFLPTHAYLIKGREPILIETGLYTQAEGFLEALRAEIDPAELRWIAITHEDLDHAGNLEAMLQAAPKARLVLSFLAMLKIARMDLTPPDRVLIATPGQPLTMGEPAIRRDPPAGLRLVGDRRLLRRSHRRPLLGRLVRRPCAGAGEHGRRTRPGLPRGFDHLHERQLGLAARRRPGRLQASHRRGARSAARGRAAHARRPAQGSVGRPVRPPREAGGRRALPCFPTTPPSESCWSR